MMTLPIGTLVWLELGRWLKVEGMRSRHRPKIHEWVGEPREDHLLQPKLLNCHVD